MLREIQDAIREAMLTAQSDWLTKSDLDAKANNTAGHAIARVIAHAFETEARKYKVADENRVGVNDQAYDAFISNTENGEEK